MDSDTARIVGMVCAGIAVISTVVYYAFKAREMRALEAIRDSLKKNERIRAVT